MAKKVTDDRTHGPNRLPSLLPHSFSSAHKYRKKGTERATLNGVFLMGGQIQYITRGAESNDPKPHGGYRRRKLDKKERPGEGATWHRSS